MSKGNKTPSKSNKPNLTQNIEEKRAHTDAKENVENRKYKGRVL
jgi:hypothetical protein